MATEADATLTKPSDAPEVANQATSQTDAPAAEPAAQPGPWGDDWRSKSAGGNAKTEKLLGRYGSPTAFVEAHMALTQKMATGDLKPALSESPTDDEVSAYRESNGIPSEPGGYLDDMPDGLIVGTDDKPIVENFIQDMHSKNMPPAAVHAAMKWYYSEIEERRTALTEEDRRVGQAVDDELRAEWGGDYRANMNAANALMESAPGDVGSLLKGARLGDGSPLTANADAMRWLSHLSNEMNPAGTIVPGGGAQQIDSLEGKKTELEQLMRSDPPAYAKRRGEYTKVITALEKIGARAA